MVDSEDFPSPTQTNEPEQLEKGFVPPQALYSSFVTEHGSVYTYDENGHTSRFKRATNERLGKKGITVFAKLTPEQERHFLAVTYPQIEIDEKLWVVERQEDDSALTIGQVEQVKHPDRLFLAVTVKGQIVETSPATLIPTVGYDVFDADVYKDGKGELAVAGHLGHRVTQVNSVSESAQTQP